MNLNNLNNGMTVKNYKEMCKLLNENTEEGNTKVSQLKRWEAYFKFEKKGHKFIIIEIYKKPFEVVGRSRNNSKQLDITEKAFTHLLLLTASQEEDRVLLISKSELFKSLGYYNVNYQIGRENKDELVKMLSVSEVAYDYFYDNTYQKYKSSIERLLKAMSRRKKIIYESVRCVVDDSGFCREATNEELKLIIDAERDVLTGLGYKEISAVYIHKNETLYYRRINKKLKAHNIKKTFNAYKIVVADTYKNEIIDEVNYLIENGDTMPQLLTSMNEILRESNHKTFDKKHKSIVNRFEEWGDPYEDKDKVYIKPEFVTDGDKLFDTCCAIENQTSIESQLKQIKVELNMKQINK